MVEQYFILYFDGEEIVTGAKFTAKCGTNIICASTVYILASSLLEGAVFKGPHLKIKLAMNSLIIYNFTNSC